MKASIGGDFTNPEEGISNARLYSIVDIGDQSADWGTHRQIVITWELDQPMDDGRPFVISKFYKLSLHEKANLCIDFEGMLGRKLTTDDKENMDFQKWLGFPCRVVLQKKIKKDGGDRIVAASFMPMKKGEKPLNLQNDKVFFDLDAYDHSVYEDLPEWLQKRVNLKNKKEMFKDDDIPGFETEEVDEESPDYDPFAA